MGNVRAFKKLDEIGQAYLRGDISQDQWQRCFKAASAEQKAILRFYAQQRKLAGDKAPPLSPPKPRKPAKPQEAKGEDPADTKLDFPPLRRRLDLS